MHPQSGRSKHSPSRSSYELAPLGVDIAIVEPAAYQTNIGNSGVQPDDAQRLTGYSEVTPLMANIFGALETTTQGRDSREVADAIFAIAQRPAGARPLRTPVPAEPEVTAINDAVAPIQRKLLEHLGLSELLPKAPALA